MDAQPVLDPDPLPNIILHPGDRIYYSRWDNGTVEYRLLDRDGHAYAVLDGHGHPERPGDFVIDAIRYVSDLGGRELLPVRPEPDTVSVSDPDVLGATAVARRAYTDWVTQPQPNAATVGPTAGVLAVRHDHTHIHAGDGADIHAHQHTHTGADAFHTADAGHASGRHDDHQHDDPEPDPAG